MKNILIIGDGGFAKEVAFLIDSINLSQQNKEWNILGYIAKDESDIGKQHGKYSIFNCDEWLYNTEDEIHVAIGIGDPGINVKIILKLKSKKNISFPNLIHPNVVIDTDQITLGEGNIICAGNIVSVDLAIGSFNIFNMACTIGHDCKIGDFNIFNPSVNLSGGIIIGDKNLVGTGAHIFQYLNICSDNKIGAGAVINFDIEESGTYVVAGARRIR